MRAGKTRPAEVRRHLAVMKKAALEAAAFQMKNYGKLSRAAVRAKSANDFVTFVDKKSQDMIVGRLRKAFRDYGFLAEEEDPALKTASRTWVIDPLDGTTNYIHDIPMFCVSIALKEGKKVLAGLVHDVVHNETFAAAAGNGATLNGRRIRVSKCSSLDNAFVCTGFPFRCKKRFGAYHESFRRVFYVTGGARRMGSAAQDLCYVACGRFDGFWELGLKEWDTAAASLIVREAGGKVTDFSGGNGFLQSGDTLAGNPRIHTGLKAVLSRVPGLKASLATK